MLIFQNGMMGETCWQPGMVILSQLDNHEAKNMYLRKFKLDENVTPAESLISTSYIMTFCNLAGSRKMDANCAPEGYNITRLK